MLRNDDKPASLADGRLRVHVYPREIEIVGLTMSCWAYLSQGFWEHFQQREILFTWIARAEDTEPPYLPLHYLETCFRLAERGQVVDVGDFTEFGDDFLGHKAIIYAEAETDVDRPHDLPLMAAIGLHESEYKVFKDFGYCRLLAKLGEQAAYFPYPYWTSPHRDSLELSSMLEESLLLNVPRMRMRGCWLRAEQRVLHLNLLESLKGQLQEAIDQLQPSNAFALLPDPDPSAGACLVWEPGQQEPKAIVAPGADASALGGCFFLALPQQQRQMAQIFEDGFVLSLRDDTWEQLRQAILDGEGFELDADDPALGYGFRLNWVMRDYYNPFDETIYSSPSGWQTYGSDNDTEGVSILLLHSDAVLIRNVDTEEAAAHIKQAIAAVRGFYGTGHAPQMLLQIELRPDHQPIYSVASPEDEDLLQPSALQQQLSSLPDLRSNDERLLFHLHFEAIDAPDA